MDNDELYIACAPADAPRVIPGSVFTHKCYRCDQSVVMAPSGQKMLAENPEAKVICAFCVYDGPAGVAFVLEEAKAELARGSVPNMRRYRN